MKQPFSAVTMISALLFCATACAQEYPNRLVRIVTGGSLGGPVDIAARAIAQKMSDAWGQPVIVESRPGAGEIIATEAVSKARPDGYTLLIAGNPFTHNPYLFAKLPYDAVRGFMPITLLAQSPMALVALAKAPFNSVEELVAAAKLNPGKVAWGSAGMGTNNHIVGEQFAAESGIRILHVPFKGSQGATNAVLGGEVQFGIVALSSAMPLTRAGTFKVLAVTTEKRTSLAPDLPTLAERGVPGIDAGVPAGLYAPSGTPGPVIEKLNAEANRALQDPALRERFVALGMEPLGTTPEEFAAKIRKIAANVERIVSQVKIRLD